MSSKISRRSCLAGSLGLVLGTTALNSAFAEEASEDVPWKYVKLCPQKVGQSVYDSFGKMGCMYGAVKGAVLTYADTVAASDANAAAVARAFPFFAMQGGRGGCGGLKSLCGGVEGAAIFMGFFITKKEELNPLIQKLGEYAKETALPQFKPADDKYPDHFPTAVAHGITCKEMGSAWMATANEDFKKVVGERCKRHTASILAKAVELLNTHFKC